MIATKSLIDSSGPSSPAAERLATAADQALTCGKYPERSMDLITETA